MCCYCKISRSTGRCNCHTEVWNSGQKCLALGVIYTHNVIKQEKQEAICIQIYTLRDFFLISKKKFFLSFGKHRRFLSVLTISILDKWHWERGLSHPFLELLQFAKKINNKLSVRYFNMKYAVINNFSPPHYFCSYIFIRLLWFSPIDRIFL